MRHETFFLIPVSQSHVSQSHSLTISKSKNMNTRHNFRKLEIYQRSLKLASDVLLMVDEIRPYRLGEQLAGSCISIPSNISEGADRGSDKEFVRFLQFASGSAAELETQLILVKQTQKYNQYPIDNLIKETYELNSMIRAFMQKLSPQ
jgi:four helix bundle protein